MRATILFVMLDLRFQWLLQQFNSATGNRQQAAATLETSNWRPITDCHNLNSISVDFMHAQPVIALKDQLELKSSQIYDTNRMSDLRLAVENQKPQQRQ